jgi:murein L,D-transpeptidase YafK
MMRLLRLALLASIAVTCALPPAFAGSADESCALGDQALYVWKRRRLMVLREGDQIVRRFEIGLGTQPDSPKLRRGDNRTPEGTYYVREKKTQSSYHRFIGLSYPNVGDADRGLQTNLISQEEWADIFFANLRGVSPPSSTGLGGRIGIHGYGTRPQIVVDWTQGCIAVRNDDIDYLFDRVRIGTPVHIKE